MEYNGKKALVCGMARSGIAAAKLLNRLGARVTLQDMKKERKFLPMCWHWRGKASCFTRAQTPMRLPARRI